MQDDDRRLVTAILSGEPDRFAELVERFTPGVRRIVGRDVRDAGLCDELVQTTFLLAFRGLGRLEAPERLEAWLARIARNAVADELARRRSTSDREIALDGLDFEARGEAHGAARGRELGGWIWEEVARLTPDAREILELRYRDGLSYAEVAARLGVPTSTVRGRIYEARRALRRRLEALEDRP
jgi:RNA polymerase sigma-70 factor (ECF subfamily)